MSIHTTEIDDSNQVITLGTVNSWAFKVAIWCAPIFAIWALSTMLRHDKVLDVHEFRLTALERNGRGGVSQSVNVGSADETAADASAHRDFLTVEEVADRIGYSVRTVQALCASGEIAGAVQPEGTRGWKIPKDFTFRRQTPQTAVVSGIQPQP